MRRRELPSRTPIGKNKEPESLPPLRTYWQLRNIHFRQPFHNLGLDIRRKEPCELLSVPIFDGFLRPFLPIYACKTDILGHLTIFLQNFRFKRKLKKTKNPLKCLFCILSQVSVAHDIVIRLGGILESYKHSLQPKIYCPG